MTRGWEKNRDIMTHSEMQAMAERHIRWTENAHPPCSRDNVSGTTFAARRQ